MSRRILVSVSLLSTQVAAVSDDWANEQAVSKAALAVFLMQLFIVLAFAKILAKIFSYFRQPAVIGEMIGGILLGPSAFGTSHKWSKYVFPDFQAGIKCTNLSFPFQPFLYIAAQLGLIFFMFYLGLEIQPHHLLGHWRQAVPIAISSILLPFALGIGLSDWFWTLTGTNHHDPPINYTVFALFLGTCMSFTAFPVLGRILVGTKDGKGLTSEVGILAVAVAAVDDLAAWLCLALVLVYDHGQKGIVGFYDVLLLICFLVVQGVAIKWILGKIHAWLVSKDREFDPLFTMLIFLGLLFSAWVAEIIGVHALFGSFIFGFVVPKTGKFAEDLCPKIELLVVNVFVPLYFAYSGLNTKLASLNTAALVFAMLFQTFLASVGKILPVVTISYFGLKRSAVFSTGLGFLINTRGLVSLIAANIGRTEGIFNPTVFSMLVLVNVLTTIATPPVFYTLYESYGLNKQYVSTHHHAQDTEMMAVSTKDPSDPSTDEKANGDRELTENLTTGTSNPDADTINVMTRESVIKTAPSTDW